ncbi:MAG: peptidylprolyl isomerase [Firmicutes bacterium HGW-Firmicutes-21]|nr:MAG: peptidylprolyl isomerase [Firmicutes bacterium HGW-Firmicutes-21]
MVQIEMKDGGKIIIELYPEIAPITVNNFKKLVSEGFYDGLIFHRVMSGFMIQGGDPKGTGTGGPGYTIKGEFSENGIVNDLKHTRGVISMARSDGKDTAGSQFFIMHADTASLDGKYAAFGKVLEGMDVVDQIAAVKVNSQNKPTKDQIMKAVTFLDDYTPVDDISDVSEDVSDISEDTASEDNS